MEGYASAGSFSRNQSQKHAYRSDMGYSNQVGRTRSYRKVKRQASSWKRTHDYNHHSNQSIRKQYRRQPDELYLSDTVYTSGNQTDTSPHRYHSYDSGLKPRRTHTIHNERNGIIVSSDDSSDDDDIMDDVLSLSSHYSGSSTIHNESNGIWVSSDEESECDELCDQFQAASLRYAHNNQEKYAHNQNKMQATFPGYATDRAHSSRMTRINNNNSYSDYDYPNRGYPVNANRLTKQYPNRTNHNFFDSSQYSPSHRSISSSSCSTGITTDGGSSNSSCNGSPHARTLRRRRTLSNQLAKTQTAPLYSYDYSQVDTSNKNVSVNQEDSDEESNGGSNEFAGMFRRYQSMDTGLPTTWEVPMSNENVSADFTTDSCMKPCTDNQQGYDNPICYDTASSDQNYAPFNAKQPYATESHNTTYTTYSEPCEQVQSYIKLHNDEFWDPFGRNARLSEQVLFGGGVTACAILLYYCFWISAAFSLVFTCISTSWFCTKYRILRWRAKSGIGPSEVFNSLYHSAENVCIDTCIQKVNGEMIPRQVCAGEVALALRNNESNKLVLKSILLRFWVEACVHFRLTLRSGCQHLGEGKLRPNRLTSASLVRLNSGKLPENICISCKNKTEIEAKLPLKFN